MWMCRDHEEEVDLWDAADGELLRFAREGGGWARGAV
jgi:hypothetical protein